MREQILAEIEEGVGLRRWIGEHLAEPIERVARRMIACYRAGGTIYFCGNGGSAADSQHLAAELVGRLRHDSRPLAAIALTTDTSALTAIANDFGFERVFARQVRALVRPGDLLFALSTSGRSPNILAAVAAARAAGAHTVALAGGDGPLAGLVDEALVIPARDSARVQECLLTIGHILCGLVECWALEQDGTET
jgi:D-sedoheptulose 7-phosphate isomerase